MQSQSLCTTSATQQEYIFVVTIFHSSMVLSAAAPFVVLRRVGLRLDCRLPPGSSPRNSRNAVSRLCRRLLPHHPLPRPLARRASVTSSMASLGGKGNTRRLDLNSRAARRRPSYWARSIGPLDAGAVSRIRPASRSALTVARPRHGPQNEGWTGVLIRSATQRLPRPVHWRRAGRA